MSFKRLSPFIATLLFSGIAVSQPPQQQDQQGPPAGRGQQGPPGGRGQRPARKQLLVWCQTDGGGAYHESVNRAMAVLQNMGQVSGLFDAYLRTDSQLITKKPIVVNADGQDWRNNKNLNYFDAIFFCGLREIQLRDDQKADLLSFVRDDGKGFIAAHAADNAFLSWPDYADMLGSNYDGHPWGQVEGRIINEDPKFPGMNEFPLSFTFNDEMYQVSNFSREKSRVLLRLDTASVDMKHQGVHRTDGDFPQAWVKSYGKGRVFVCAFGHASAVWDRPDIQGMWREAIKWAMGMTEADTTPRPMQPAPPASPAGGRGRGGN